MDHIAALRRPRRSIVFTVAVTAAIVIGTLVIALVLVVTGAPAAIMVGAFLAVLPVGPVIASYMWLDRNEPEPPRLLVTALAWGALVATSAALVIQVGNELLFGGSVFYQMVITAPLSEEFAKGIFIVLLFWLRRQDLDGVIDGIVYAGMIGIGFAFTENILYLASAYTGDDQIEGGFGPAVVLFILRGMLSPFAHPFFTGFIGIGLGIAATNRHLVVRLLAPMLGYGFAVLAHASWNAIMVSGDIVIALLGYAAVMFPGFVMFIAFAVWMRRRERRILRRALTDCARRGFIHPNEVAWLADPIARRTARRYADRHGGPAAAAVMKEYQATVVDLGFLHHRYLLGVPPAHYDALGQNHLARMSHLRSGLLWPQHHPQPTGAYR